ncbi:MAG TPA: SBBP repeat-containing protein [Saprospiraceae bacterium]|nr:SBBP repeat-containing protein [Saprospiraceae bacterium]
MKWYAFLPIMFLPFSTQAQFGLTVQLTDSDSISYLPYTNAQCIAVSGQIVHIVWTDRRDGADEVFYKRSMDGGINWDADVRLTADDNIYSGRANIVVWNNEVHVVWMDRRDGNNELYYKRSINNGNTWGNDTRLTTNSSTSENPSLVIDFQTLHLAWNDKRDGQNEIYYKRSTNGGLSWTADTRLTNNAGESIKPSVAIADTLVHVIWEDLRNGTSEIFYKRSLNNGMAWGNDTKLSNSTTACYAPCISANGEIAFATWDDRRITNSEVFGRRTIDGGVSWSPDANYTNSNGDSYDAHHAFSGTYMSMTYTENNNNDADIYLKYSTDAGLSWITNVTTIEGNFSDAGQSFVAIDGAAVHVLYQDDNNGNLEIMYGRDPNGNPFYPPQSPVWAHQINSAQRDIAYAMTSDAHSNIYVAGIFSGTVDFDPGPDIYPLTADDRDAFVYKINPDGELVWAKRIGGQETDIAFDIALDSDDNVVLTGSFHGTVDFDPGAGSVNIGAFGQEDIFVLKLTNAGEYQWARRIGGDGKDEPQSIVIDASNNIYVTGYFSETVDFDPGPNTESHVSKGDEDIFIFSLNEQGELSWAKSIGSTGNDVGRSIAVDDNRIVVTGGFTNTTDFDPGDGQQDLTSIGENDIFILQMTGLGAFSWVQQFGNVGEDEGNGITMDTAGNVYATGYSTNTITPSFKEDVMVYALTSSGGFRWFHRTGVSGSDMGKAIAFSHDYLYVAGTFERMVDFNPGPKEIFLRASGSKDIFLQKLDARNGDHLCVNQFGGVMEDVPSDVAVVPYGKIGVTGYFEGTADFSPNIQQATFISTGEEDGFVTLIRECEPSYATLSLTVCSGLIFSNGSSFSESGTYTIVTESASGCDSIISLELTILSEPHTTVTETSCNSYTTPSGNHTWTETGVYTETNIAANGCDSIITYNITIPESTSSTIEVSSCEMYTDDKGNILTASGAYTSHFTSVAGCDSTATLILTINQPTFAVWAVDACRTYTTPEGDSTWTQSGIYHYTIPNAAGCDSTITLDLAIIKYDTTVIQEGATLTAADQPINYQWLDCNAAFAVIPGETNPSFVATISGSYAVELGYKFCYDTTSCYQVVVVGIDHPEIFRDAIIYPNPTRDNVSIRLSNSIPHVDAVLTDLQGRDVWRRRINISSNTMINMPQMPGIYLLTLTYDDYTRTFRAVKM